MTETPDDEKGVQSLDQRLQALSDAGEDERAREIARDGLTDQDVDHVIVDGDVACVHAGSFVGHHAIRRDQGGDAWATTKGSYVHEPTGVECDGECPDPMELDDAVRDTVSGEGPGGAARASYRRSRL